MIVRAAAVLLAAAVVAWTFAPALGFPFLNWDDAAVVVENTALDHPDVVRWAFTTTYMEHYQPISWLVWSGIKRAAGTNPAAFHAANLIAHLACVLLVFVLAAELMRRAVPTSDGRRVALAAVAALLFGVHPLRVEVVAWISALPYALALLLSLLALLAWLRTTGSVSTRWWVAALVLFIASLAARPVALGLPVVLVVLDGLVLSQPAGRIARRVWPFVLVAAIAAIAESVARAPGVNDAPLSFRLQSALQAPLVYVWHTVAPLQLTPLDLLPANPTADAALTVASFSVLAAVIGLAWRWRHRHPWIAAAVAAYLALLAPAAGLISSGLQATADRYTYVPGVVLAIAVAATGAHWARINARRAWMAGALAGVVVAGCVLSTRHTLEPWASSIALWSRVVELDPRHDVGLYNLGTALAAAGRRDEAAARYREALAVAPAHAAARANVDRLDAVRLEREGSAAASRGDLKAAAESYRGAVALDRQRTHAQAGLGMALASLGRTAEAIPALREAVAQGIDDPMVPNALAGLLAESGQTREARRILEAALAAHASDVSLAHNLARLLATDSQFARTDAALALRLASAVVDASGGRDPRALDTLAAALSINGRVQEAAEMSDRAARVALAQGDRELAAQITARGRGYRGR